MSVTLFPYPQISLTGQTPLKRWQTRTALVLLVLLSLVSRAGSVWSVGLEPGTPTLPPADSPYWLPPLGTPLEVSGPYRPPPTPYASGHRGIDLPATPGELVHAPVGGVVSFVGQVADRHVLSVRVDSRTVVSFEPIEQADAALAEGAQVLPRQPLGIVAEGGHCLDECLHLGVRVDDEYVNPLRYFLGKPVLLPW